MLSFILDRIFRNMIPGEPRHKRIFHPTNMAKNVTVIVYPGPLDAHRLAGAMEVLKGDKYAQSYRQKKAPLFEGKEVAA